MKFFTKCFWLRPSAYLCEKKWINRIIAKRIHSIILELCKFLACLECISRNGLCFGHSDLHTNSVCSVENKLLYLYVQYLFSHKYETFDLVIVKKPIFNIQSSIITKSADDMPGTWGLDRTKKREEEFVREFPTSITEMAHCQK